MHKKYFLFILIFFPVALFAQDHSGQEDVHSLQVFYNLWMMLTGGIFSLVFYLLWQMKSKENAPQDKIEGILWFSRALAVWCISGLSGLLALHFQLPNWINLFTSGLSTINSVFILFIIPSIEIKPGSSQLLKEIVALAKNKLGVILLGFGTIAATLFVFWLFSILPIASTDLRWHWLYGPDILFSIFTILSLLLVFKEAFRDEKRHVSLMVWVVYITLLITLLAEVGLTIPAWAGFPLEKLEVYWILYTLVATSFKSLLVILFAILLYSYELKNAEDLKETALLSDEEIKEKWNLELKEVLVLRYLAAGKTRTAIGDMRELFPNPRTERRKTVDDLLTKIALKLGLRNDIALILLFALHNKIVPYLHPSENNLSGNSSGENPAPE
ncbi:hypothetical protein [Haliscomenobacter hydrossis]|uniref:Uncharacterized protein n=1 Tax=Haliscomenobacter hydrossis (strain ATCC 27775 / DSM 1100 / LMG 10767 / O) TaxID=760192 RepID=F4L2P3_HALH1|nr:hypothetical protein [Haliscomenobacter hydrossis]AEE48607.1 hypothetical protein Halhy_0699 [Haliscomenobacter hydrossis DSM 1100]